MQLALKSPAIDVDVWLVIFHSKLPQDFGSGTVSAAEFHTPTGGPDRPWDVLDEGAVGDSRPV